MVDRIKTQQRAAARVSVDGFAWNAKTEAELNRLALLVFEKPDGARFLEYLKNITINRRLPPGSTIEQLAHMEGQRWIVGIIMDRLNRGASASDDDPMPEVPDLPPHEPETDQS